MKTNDPLDHIKIASPCSTRWEDMTGDARARFCAHCQKNVFNLSALSATEAAALIRAKEGNLCVRLYQRADGTVLTADCPVGAAQVWQRVQRLVAAAAALMVVSLTLAFSAKGAEDQSVRRSRAKIYQAWDDALLAAKNWIHPPPPPKLGKFLMGDVCTAPVRTNAPPAMR